MLEAFRNLRRPSDFRLRVPLPFGTCQSPETVIQATKTMAELVCRIGGTQYPVLRAVHSIMEDNVMPEDQKDAAIRDLIFPPSFMDKLSRSLKQKLV